ncbi:hypothetical protein INT43_008340 [Umbelopsis isabellina]|uniref:EIPR1-like beta-propeller domain-containing protein n=1 Tax=Mortierella isabellina TaxID=91625 RepID=A0A8H7PCY3_MORIS|nr:hypothetical protein INT43_008340 [Umbelopsis isabellina]
MPKYTSAKTWKLLDLHYCAGSIGSVGNENNVQLYEDQALTDPLLYPRFKLQGWSAGSDPVHSLASYDESLLVGSKKGVVRLFDVKAMDDANDQQEENSRERVEDSGQSNKIGTINEAIESNDAGQNNVSEPTDDIKQTRKMQQVAQSNVQEDNLLTYGQVAPNTHVKSLQFSRKRWAIDMEMPSVKTMQFGMLVDTSMYIWDMENESAPVYTKKMGTEPLNACHWSPHAPYNMIAIGGYSGALDIVDNRVPSSAQPVWTSAPCHKGGIFDVQFSPIISYWIASAGEDGITKIWDIRYGHPVAKIEGHDRRVNSVTWANLHPEILCTCSSDSSLKMWSLTPGTIPVKDTYERLSGIENEYAPIYVCSGAAGIGEWGAATEHPVFVGEDIQPCQGPIVQVHTSQHMRSMFYCITSEGQLTAHNVRYNTRDGFVIHNYDKEENFLAYQIETDVFKRNLYAARGNLHLLKEKYGNSDSNAKMIDDLMDLVLPTPAIDPESWSPNSLPTTKQSKRQSRLWQLNDSLQEAAAQYEQELLHWTRHLPPGITEDYMDQLRPIKDVTEEPPEDSEELNRLQRMDTMLSKSERISLRSSDSSHEIVFSEPASADTVEAPQPVEQPKPHHHHHHLGLSRTFKSIRRSIRRPKRTNSEDTNDASIDLERVPSLAASSRRSTRRHALV